MAHSPASAERRAHLIREMARQSDRSHSRGSAASSAGSAREGGRNDTGTQQLPPLRREPDFQINTSALRRAFPDFSQYGSSEEDSIEVGRGVKRSARNIQPRNDPSADVSENISFTLGDGSRYQVTGTPPIKPRNMNTKATVAERSGMKSLERGHRLMSTKKNDALIVEASNYEPDSNKGGPNERRTLAEIHARVDSEDSVSLSEGRPAHTMVPAKSTRFGNKRTRQTSTHTTGSSNHLPRVEDTVRASEKPQTLEQAIQSNTVTSISAGNGTYQSFLLPDLPNITELVSGVRQDGTSVFPHSAKSRSRFGTPSRARRSSNTKQAYVPISTVPIPIDEKALYLSLQLLQEKVTGLENDKAKMEKQLEEYELEVLQLRSKLEEREHRYPDTGLGTDQENGKAKPDHVEKSRLETAMKSLQERLDRANRKLSASEATISNVTRDRDAAHQQLAMAYLSAEELKSESQAVRDEIESVTKEVSRLTREHGRRIERLNTQEKELRAKIERREKAVREMGSLAKELWNTRIALSRTKVPATEDTLKDAQQNTIVDADKSREKSHGDAESRRLASNVGAPRLGSRFVAKAGNNLTTMEDMQRASLPSIDAGNLSDADSTTNIQSVISASKDRELVRDETYLSFMEGDEIVKLKQIVEADKALLAKTSSKQPQQRANDAIESTRNTGTIQPAAVPRKSSLKSKQRNSIDYTVQSELDADFANEQNKTHDRVARDDVAAINSIRPSVSFSREKEDTQRSLLSQRSERPRRNGSEALVEMTSAFILPDITMAGAAMPGHQTAVEAASQGKQTTVIARPVPVSDRMPVHAIGEEDATIRPAQPPGLALATVLKGLEDELTQLRAQLSQQQTLYHQHDPSLSKRKRKIVYARIQKLLAAIDIRADQIYALYDVLEGQKEKDQLMREEEVEVTLQNIGIDVSAARRTVDGEQVRSDVAVDGSADVQSDVEDEGSEDGLPEDDEELPWEGFEPTQTQTIGSLGALRVR